MESFKFGRDTEVYLLFVDLSLDMASDLRNAALARLSDITGLKTWLDYPKPEEPTFASYFIKSNALLKDEADARAAAKAAVDAAAIAGIAYFDEINVASEQNTHEVWQGTVNEHVYSIWRFSIYDSNGVFRVERVNGRVSVAAGIAGDRVSVVAIDRINVASDSDSNANKDLADSAIVKLPPYTVGVCMTGNNITDLPEFCWLRGYFDRERIIKHIDTIRSISEYGSDPADVRFWAHGPYSVHTAVMEHVEEEWESRDLTDSSYPELAWSNLINSYNKPGYDWNLEVFALTARNMPPEVEAESKWVHRVALGYRPHPMIYNRDAEREEKHRLFMKLVELERQAM